MVFNLCIGFQDLTTKACKATEGVPRPYSVLIADTLVITADEPESLTRLPREFKDVSYTFRSDGDDAAKAADEETEAAAAAADAADRRSTRGVGKDSLRVDMAAEESEAKRAAHQKELSRRKQEEALRRYAAGDVSESGNTSASFDLSVLHAYKSVNDIPTGRVNSVKVDPPNDCVLFPINDQLVPFHISTILRVYKRDENGFTFLNVKLQVPDTAAARAKMKVHKGLQYISELTYRTATTSLDKPYFEVTSHLLLGALTSSINQRVHPRSLPHSVLTRCVCDVCVLLDGSDAQELDESCEGARSEAVAGDARGTSTGPQGTAAHAQGHQRATASVQKEDHGHAVRASQRSQIRHHGQDQSGCT